MQVIKTVSRSFPSLFFRKTSNDKTNYKADCKFFILQTFQFEKYESKQSTIGFDFKTLSLVWDDWLYFSLNLNSKDIDEEKSAIHIYNNWA